jgi:hypothetical protein
MFRKLVLSLAAAAGMVAQLVLPAEAAMDVGAFAPRAALVESSPVEQAQFVWGGRNYCWYNSAWRGPGWYQCGFAWRRGFGWGGAAGWHGWRHPGFVHRPVHRPPVHRPPVLGRPSTGRPSIARAATGPATTGRPPIAPAAANAAAKPRRGNPARRATSPIVAPYAVAR